jgi:hypothetical protein
MEFAPRSDLDAVQNKTTTTATTTTGYTHSSGLTNVMEWPEDEQSRVEGWDEERRTGKKRQVDPEIEVMEYEEDMEMVPVRRATRRHFVEDGSGPVDIR